MISDRKVDLMIIGAQKAGTTSLKNYLGQHPKIVTHLQTEFTYYFPNSPDGSDFDLVFKYYFPVSTEGNSAKLIAKCAAMYVDEESLQRLKNANPECLLVLLMRNPVDRAYSSYLMELNSGMFDKPWSAIITSLKKSARGERDHMFKLFIEMGMYSEHLKKVYRHFPREQVLLFLFEDFTADPAAVCQKLFSRLNVDASFKTDVSKKYNPAKRPRMRPLSKLVTNFRKNDNPVKKFIKKMLPSPTYAKVGDWVVNAVSLPHQPELMAVEIQEQLVEYFKPYNEELRNMTGLETGQWNK